MTPILWAAIPIAGLALGTAIEVGQMQRVAVAVFAICITSVCAVPSWELKAPDGARVDAGRALIFIGPKQYGYSSELSAQPNFGRLVGEIAFIFSACGSLVAVRAAIRKKKS